HGLRRRRPRWDGELPRGAHRGPAHRHRRGRRRLHGERPALVRRRLPRHHPDLAVPSHRHPGSARMITDLKLAAQSLGRWGWGALGACVVVVALFPYLANPYIVSFALSIGMYAVLAGSWNLISGYAGYVSFGHVVYWGIGAYGAAIVMARTSLPWPVALL